MHLQHKHTNEKYAMKNTLLVDQIVGGGLVKGVVELEHLVVQVLGEIHLLLGLVHEQGTFSWHRHHVYLLFVHLWNRTCSSAEAGLSNAGYSGYSPSGRTHPAC